MPIRFTVTVDDIEYQCSREIEKEKNEYRQTVTVAGVGIADDPNLYPEDYMRNGYMEFQAKQVAISIIGRK